MFTKVVDFFKTVETKKVVAFMVVGTLCAIILVGALVPAAREYVVTVSKPLIETVGGLVK